MPVLKTNSEARKRIPLATGVLDYFPAALAAVAEVSYAGNQKHNPGEPLHWSRGKSGDHADALVRHLLERGGTDPNTGMRHSAEMAWRALALLQEELEAAGETVLARGATSVQEAVVAAPPRCDLCKARPAVVFFSALGGYCRECRPE